MFGLTSKPFQNAPSQPAFGVTLYSMRIAELAESLIQFFALRRLAICKAKDSVDGNWSGGGLQCQWKALEREDGFEPPSPGWNPAHFPKLCYSREVQLNLPNQWRRNPNLCQKSARVDQKGETD